MMRVPSPPAQRNTRWPRLIAADRSTSSTAQALTSRWPSAMKRGRSQTVGSRRRIHASTPSDVTVGSGVAGSAVAGSAVADLADLALADLALTDLAVALGALPA